METKTVAVVGASADRSKFSNKSIRAHERMGWTVYPVNPKGGEIEGHPVFKSIRDIPAKLRRVSMYLPAAVGIGVLPDIAAVAPEEFWVNPGAESDELIEAAKALGLQPIQACSIVDVGMSPAQLSE
ncbi:MAG: CoA-binding protein [Phycisphaerales bacterium]|nr:CoA-binding protein [Phycisphaerales bacterium]MCB9863623.1 CoA-binding protein [Phycisphaerales bacterium]